MPSETEALQREFVKVTRETPLHELVDRVLTILTDVDAAEGEVSADQDAQLDALNLSIERKVEAYGAAYQQLGAGADANKALAAYYTRKAKQLDASGERLRERLHAELQRIGRDVVKTDTASARIQSSPDRLELEEQDEAVLFSRYGAEIPPEFVVQPPPKLNRKAVIDALKAGREFTWAWLVKSTHLRFR